MGLQRVRHNWATELKRKKKLERLWKAGEEVIWHHDNIAPRSVNSPSKLGVGCGQSLYHNPIAIIQDNTWDPKNRLSCVEYSHTVAVVQSLSHVQLFATPWTVAHQTSMSITIYWSFSNSCLLSQWCYLTISSSAVPFSCLQSFLASGSFSNELALRIRWWKNWCFSFSISIIPSNEYPGFISFRIDSFDLLAVQGTLKNVLQHHSWKASILWCSAFFMVQLSHLYRTTGKP